MPILKISQEFIENYNKIRSPFEDEANQAFPHYDPHVISFFRYSERLKNDNYALDLTRRDFHRSHFISVKNKEQHDLFDRTTHSLTANSISIFEQKYAPHYRDEDLDYAHDALDRRLQKFMMTHFNQGGFANDAAGLSLFWSTHFYHDVDKSPLIFKSPCERGRFCFFKILDRFHVEYVNIERFNFIEDMNKNLNIPCNFFVESRAQIGLKNDYPVVQLTDVNWHFKEQSDLDTFSTIFTIDQQTLRAKQQNKTWLEKFYQIFYKAAVILQTLIKSMMSWIWPGRTQIIPFERELFFLPHILSIASPDEQPSAEIEEAKKLAAPVIQQEQDTSNGYVFVPRGQSI
ncbi:hypothetical protein EBR43_00055 [bacterium]|nr:hypothetical protein [bacterium]NBW56181.1 hypothetical protein [bacterium]NBX72252.1 hypothetical protein [bacterium]